MKKQLTLVWLVLAAVVAGPLVLKPLGRIASPSWAASAPAVKIPPVLSFATAAEGTNSYIIGGAFANVLQKYLKVKVAIEPSGAANRWVPLMAQKEVDFGLHCSYPDMHDAYYGTAGYQKMGPQPVMGFIDGHIVPWGLISNDSKIKTIYDLKGKRLYGRITGQSLYLRNIPALLAAAGLTGKVEVLTFPNVNEAARGLAEGRADALVYLPTVAALMEVSRTSHLYAVTVPKEVVEKVHQGDASIMYGIWKKGEAFAAQDTPSMFFGCGMAVRASLAPGVVETILRTLYDHYDEYKGAHSVLPEWSLKNAIRIHVIPFHPGAIAYFKEKGIWTAAAEKRNQELISQRRSR